MVKAQKDGSKLQTAPSGAVLLSGGEDQSIQADRSKAKPKSKLARGKLPRGITEIRWENATGPDSVRYRIRIKRKSFTADKIFDSFHEAQQFLLMSKTKDGRLGLTEREERATVLEEVARDMLSRRPFGYYMNRYVVKYIESKVAPGEVLDEVKKRSQKTVVDRIKGLKGVKLTWKPNAEKQRTGLLAEYQAPDSLARKKRLEDFYLDEIDRAVANEFLEIRSKTHAPSTVMRERGQLQTIWSKLIHIDPALEKKLPHTNPWQSADRSLIPDADTGRERHLTEEEEVRLMASLARCRNKAVPAIVGLALATGMRRGEIVMLEWGQYQDGYLTLRPSQTKKKKVRHVMLDEDGRVLIEAMLKSQGKAVPKPNQRIFPTTVNAFRLSWDRVRERANLKDFRFHDSRRTAITRMLRQMVNPSAVMISAMTGMQSVGRIESEFLQPFLDRERARNGRLSSEADIRANVGHSDARMTKHYVNLGPPKRSKTTPEK